MLANSSGQIIVAADRHKLGTVSSFLTCPIERVDLLVTDWRAPASLCDQLAAAGLQVQRAASETDSQR
jgi:DeoR/GlpR family transcriptional regulator of sugar metabolism